jgi:small subunit ribosomal protein S9
MTPKESNDKKEKTSAKKVAVKKKVVVKKKAAAVKKETKATKLATPKSAKPKPMKVQDDAIYATGRRKESTAKVWLFKGTGLIKINHLDALAYLSSDRLVEQVLTPLNVLDLNGKYDVRIDVIGGGLTGQAEASTLGLARAVLSISEEFKSTLRQNGLLTQDRREKERKKYGKRGARKSPQFRKR